MDINARTINTRNLIIASPLFSIKTFPTFMLLRLFTHALRPQHALIFLRDRAQSLVNEFLHALPAISFRHIDVAFGIRCDAVGSVKFAGLTSAFAESRHDFESVAQ